MTFTLPVTDNVVERSAFEQAVAALLEGAVSAAALGYPLYADTTAGLAATSDGDGFSVLDTTLALYLNDGGAASLQGEIPLSAVTDALDTRLDAVEAAQTSGWIDRDPVVAWAGSNITLSGSQTVDGVTLSNGDRVGVGAQSDASENGVYTYSDSGAWTRATDMDASGEISLSTVFVSGGTTYGGHSYRFSVADPDTFVLDTDDITATQVGDGGALQDQIDAIDTRVETLEGEGPQALTLGWSEGVVGAMPAGAVVDMNMLEGTTRTGSDAYVKSRGVLAASGNLITQSSGDIIGEVTTGTVTEFFANGPQGAQTAKRAQLSLNGIYDFFKDTTWPAGVWTLKVKAKLNASGTTSDVEFGAFSGASESTATETLNTSTWVTMETDITTNGAQAPRLGVKATYGAVDLLIDEVQLYPESATIPDFADETLAEPVMKSPIAIADSIIYSGGALDLTSEFKGVIPLADFPLATTFTEMTLLVVAKTSDESEVVGKMIGIGPDGDDPAIGISYGQLYAEPVMGYLDRNPGDKISNLDYQVYGLRLQAGEQSLWTDKAIHTLTTSGSVTIPDAATLFVGSVDRATNDFPFIGYETNILAFPTALSDAQMYSAVNALRARHQLTGLTGCDLDTIWYAEGDSITHNDNADPDGPSYQAQYFDTARAGIIGKNNAVSGSQLSHLETRKANLLARIEAAAAGGITPIVSVLVGANGLPTIGALESYWQDLKDAGASVIACTILPRDDGTINNTDRKTLNTAILASSVPDAFADFADDADIGADGAPTARTYYYDDVHLNAAGHAIALGIIAPVVAGLR
ncbi:SGNH/GDSL hydrolase family protein [Mameliella alba]|uniref:SGNH/GDSL hydrolase family protein n=3 Tax=Mameliella alba TaxID=561184 RepID=UPI003012F34D